MPTLYLDGRLTGFAKATKTSGSGAAKVYWRRLNSKRSLNSSIVVDSRLHTMVAGYIRATLQSCNSNFNSISTLFPLWTISTLLPLSIFASTLFPLYFHSISTLDFCFHSINISTLVYTFARWEGDVESRNIDVWMVPSPSNLLSGLDRIFLEHHSAGCHGSAIFVAIAS